MVWTSIHGYFTNFCINSKKYLDRRSYATLSSIEVSTHIQLKNCTGLAHNIPQSIDKGEKLTLVNLLCIRWIVRKSSIS